MFRAYGISVKGEGSGITVSGLGIGVWGGGRRVQNFLKYGLGFRNIPFLLRNSTETHPLHNTRKDVDSDSILEIVIAIIVLVRLSV